MKGVRRQRTLHQEHYSINQYITLAKWKELIMKGVGRQRNRGFRLALIMPRMRAFRPKNGGEHRKWKLSDGRGLCTRSTIQLISTSLWPNGKSLS